MPSDEDVIYVNGIDPETGEYAIPPFSISDLAKQVRARPGVDTVTHTRGATSRSYGLPYGVQAGWGIVFHEDAPQDVRMALAPLIELRRMQAGGNFKELDYKKGEQARDWYRRHGAAIGNPDPEIVPYYLLLVGPPTGIPFEFRYSDRDLVNYWIERNDAQNYVILGDPAARIRKELLSS